MASIDCKDVHQRIVSGGDLDAADVRAHAQTCFVCAELVAPTAKGGALARALAAEAATATALEPPDFAQLERETMARVQAPPSTAERVRQLSTPRRALLLGAGVALVVAFVAATSMRPDIGVLPAAALVINFAVLVGVALWGGALLLRPLHRPPLPASIRNLLPWVAALAPFVLAALPAAHEAHPASLQGVGDDLVPRALACFAYGTAFSLPIAGLAWLTDRSGLRARGAITIGLLAAAAIGNLVLVLHCPIVAPVHRIGGHATVSVAFLVVALGLGTVALARERPRREQVSGSPSARR